MKMVRWVLAIITLFFICLSSMVIGFEYALGTPISPWGIFRLITYVVVLGFLIRDI